MKLKNICFLLMFIVLLGLNSPSLAMDKRILPNKWLGVPEWSPDGKSVAVSYSQDIKYEKDKEGRTWCKTSLQFFDTKKLLILDAQSYEVKSEIPGDYWIETFSPDNKYLLVSKLSNYYVLDVSTGKEIFKINHGHFIRHNASWSPDSQRIAVFDSKALTIHSLKDAPPVVIGNKYKSCCFDWSPDGKHIAACFGEKQFSAPTILGIWNTSTGERVWSLENKGGLYEVSWSPDGKWFAYSDGKLHKLDVESKNEICVFDNVRVFVWSPDGNRIVAEGDSGKLKIINAGDDKVLAKIQGEKFGRTKIDWWQNGKYLVLSDMYSRLVICDGQSGEILGCKLDERFSRVVIPPQKNLLYLGRFDMDGVGKFLSLNLPKRNKETSIFKGGSTKNPWEDQEVPTNLTEAIAGLKKLLGKGLEEFKNTKQDELYKYKASMGIGIQLRNLWNLLGDSPTSSYFHKKGLERGSDISSIIIESTWRDLNNIPVEGDKQISEAVLVNSLDKVVVDENRKLPEVLKKTVDTIGSGPVKLISVADYANCKSLIEELEDVQIEFNEKDLQILVLIDKKALRNSKQSESDVNKALKYLESKKPIVNVVSGTSRQIRAFREFILQKFPEEYKAKYGDFVFVHNQVLLIDGKKSLVTKRVRSVSSFDANKKILVELIKEMLAK